MYVSNDIFQSGDLSREFIILRRKKTMVKIMASR